MNPQMPFNFNPNMIPNMFPNQSMYDMQNNTSNLNTLEKRLTTLEQKVKNIEKKLNVSTENLNDTYYQSNMYMM